MRKKLCLVFIPLPFLFLMVCLGPGCWDKREPDELGIVIGAGFDINPETGLFKVFAELANPGGAVPARMSAEAEVEAIKPPFGWWRGRGKPFLML